VECTSSDSLASAIDLLGPTESTNSNWNLEQIAGSDRTAFAYYSADLDAQWEAALDDVDLLKDRRAVLAFR
jgi:hypothetical protein